MRLRTGGETTPDCCDVGGAKAVDQLDREITEGSQNRWGEVFQQAQWTGL